MPGKPSTSPKQVKRTRKTPKWVRRPGKLLSGNRFFAPVAARLAVWYLKLTFHTNKWVVEPEDIMDRVTPKLPAIAAVWHGQHIMLPVIPLGLKGAAMISRNLDGEITARVAEAFGARTIRASGGRAATKTLKKGGMVGFLEMLKVLEKGENVLQTADIPHGAARKAGQGIILLSKRSGRPIVPIAIASSRRKTISRAWDRTTVNLPFGKSAICVGESISVSENASDVELEDARQTLENELNRITKRAYELTGVPE
ncbi:MAG: lysophospholipid acyltransferase family protein [Rhizobiaceae bacterium]